MDSWALLGLLNPKTWIDKIWGYVIRPKLRIYFDAEQTYRTLPVVDERNVPGHFCHLMVSNEGKKVAKNCRARLMRVEIRDDSGSFSCHPDFVNPVVLKWAHEPDLDPRDVEPGTPKRLDLCYTVQSRAATLSFFTHKLPSGNRTDFGPGTYRVNIRADAENCGAADAAFILKYQGIWNEIEVVEESPQ